MSIRIKFPCGIPYILILGLLDSLNSTVAIELSSSWFILTVKDDKINGLILEESGPLIVTNVLSGKNDYEY